MKVSHQEDEDLVVENHQDEDYEDDNYDDEDDLTTESKSNTGDQLGEALGNPSLDLNHR